MPISDVDLLRPPRLRLSDIEGRTDPLAYSAHQLTGCFLELAITSCFGVQLCLQVDGEGIIRLIAQICACPNAPAHGGKRRT